MKEYEEIAINELKPYENNARLHSDEQIEMIVNSINEFGFVAPVIIDENNMILVGHGRTEAAKRAGLEKVPFRRVTHLTDEQKRAYILADNKLSDLGDWDFEILTEELQNIQIDMTEFGFADLNFEEYEPERTDMSENIKNHFEIVVECNNENEQRRIFEKLTSEGLTCRVLA